MQSSTTVAFRAVVMLFCLIAIPVAALFGTSLPDLFDQLLERRGDLISWLDRGSLAEAPPFGSTARTTPTRLPRWRARLPLFPPADHHLSSCLAS